MFNFRKFVSQNATINIVCIIAVVGFVGGTGTGCAVRVLRPRPAKVVIQKRVVVPVGYVVVHRPVRGRKCIKRQGRWYCRR